MEPMQFTFFSRTLAQRYMDFCQQNNVQAEMEEETSPSGDDAVFNVTASTDDESLMEVLEAHYDELFFGDQAAEVEGNDGMGALADACGVQVKLQSGLYTTVAIHPEIMNKILSVLSIDELQQFLAQVAEDIENPKTGPICSRSDLPTI
ncbi:MULTISPECIES: hypothetical protein [Thiomicrorhabdus]|uniref:Uncharacterized protein n=1 Tax=Thiomicrorhabdus xiamenensis TaxID=2739063 RepID=A0A7D4TCU5_9GAMM|nr:MULTISPECIES: hypothetical protein [Thiomicrorhabdus]MBO1924636.1 hypothetical protein [Thiomicrorhabdus sp. 6S3-12]QKI88207.1 hypothetical protein HQN79_00765 [Thiomicrorhabdus xiamenensis]